MTVISRSGITLCGLAAAFAIAGCAGMDRATTTGAVIGGVTGAVVTDSPLGAAVGAVVGGAIGNEVGKRKN